MQFNYEKHRSIKYFLYICVFFFALNTKAIAGGWINVFGEWNLTSFGYSVPRVLSFGYIFEDLNLGFGISLYGDWSIYGQPFYQKDLSGEYVYYYEEGNPEKEEKYLCWTPLSIYLILLSMQTKRGDDIHHLHLYFHSSYLNQLWVKKGWLNEEKSEIPIITDFGIGFTLSSIDAFPISLKAGCLTIAEHRYNKEEKFFPSFSIFYVGIAIEWGGKWFL